MAAATQKTWLAINVKPPNMRSARSAENLAGRVDLEMGSEVTDLRPDNNHRSGIGWANHRLDYGVFTAT